MKTKRKPFRDHDVRAILDGTKTQFREVVKPRNSTVLGYPGATLWHHLQWEREGIFVDGRESQYLHVPACHPDEPDEELRYRVHPVLDVGDVLWVAEKWRLGDIFDDTKLSEWNDPEDVLGEYVHYAADDEQPHFVGQYRPSTQMPQWASRLTLVVQSVRVERVQAISEADAIAEGFTERIELSPAPLLNEEGGMKFYGHPMTSTHAYTFQQQWNKDHPDSWERNDWVWCVRFEVQA